MVDPVHGREKGPGTIRPKAAGNTGPGRPVSAAPVGGDGDQNAMRTFSAVRSSIAR